jgi:hypothetical protein
LDITPKKDGAQAVRPRPRAADGAADGATAAATGMVGRAGHKLCCGAVAEALYKSQR